MERGIAGSGAWTPGPGRFGPCGSARVWSAAAGDPEPAFLVRTSQATILCPVPGGEHRRAHPAEPAPWPPRRTVHQMVDLPLGAGRAKRAADAARSPCWTARGSARTKARLCPSRCDGHMCHPEVQDCGITHLRSRGGGWVGTNPADLLTSSTCLPSRRLSALHRAALGGSTTSLLQVIHYLIACTRSVDPPRRPPRGSASTDGLSPHAKRPSRPTSPSHPRPFYRGRGRGQAASTTNGPAIGRSANDRGRGAGSHVLAPPRRISTTPHP